MTNIQRKRIDMHDPDGVSKLRELLNDEFLALVEYSITVVHDKDLGTLVYIDLAFIDLDEPWVSKEERKSFRKIEYVHSDEMLEWITQEKGNQVIKITEVREGCHIGYVVDYWSSELY